ncbi:MAG: hypothetical protein EP338_01035 [Bacteroidetes bacterium]|nr:MAG: hypothetical protein EP338_01035 [Bacteroidota bacterium]
MLQSLFGTTIRNRFLFLIGFWLLLHLFYAFQLYHAGFEPRVYVSESTLSFLYALATSYILYRIHRYYHARSALHIGNLSILVVFCLGYVALDLVWAKSFLSEVSDYQSFLYSSLPLKIILVFVCLLLISYQLWIDHHEIQSKRQHKFMVSQEKQLVQMELEQLKQQIQPHFLFNALNSIHTLVKSRPEEARHMILSLSEYLRLIVQQKKEDFSRLDAELELLNFYLQIEQIRFGDRLHIHREIPDELLSRDIPVNLLQPLVENAIKHGLYGITGEFTIHIRVKESPNYLSIEIENPYDPDSVTHVRGTGFGLKAVRQKLFLLYRREGLLHTDKQDRQFLVRIDIPTKEQVDESTDH